jgi:hypothetical protein
MTRPTSESAARGRDLAPRLWAVTSYFNPVGFRRRLANYRVFRQRLAVPLVTVEVARSRDAFQLQPGDADILVQLVGEDRLWQKERLLNLAVQEVPRECDAIAWLDCDIVFERDDWAHLTRQALQRYAFIQPFAAFSELSPDAMLRNGQVSGVLGGGASSGYRLANGTTVDHLFERRRGNRMQRGSTVGLAWAAPRDLLARHGLYDAFILGGGDKAMVVAALGRFDLVASLDMNERQTAHYLAWARPFFDDVRANVGYADGRVYHLWHGDLQDRRTRQRHVAFARFDFDPSADIALDASGCWHWNSPKPEMHAYLRRYLESRHEDGRPPS